MENYKIDFLQEAARPQRGRSAAGKHLAGVALALLLVLTLGYTARAVISGQNLAEQFGQSSLWGQLRHLVGSEDRALTGEERDRINILLLGIGGDNHEGGQLTDTIILASIRPSDQTVGLLSIPRDFVAPIPGLGWQKINTANAFGQLRKSEGQGAGPELARETVQGITGLTIDYYLKIDFAGFKKVIDALGGVKINVPRAFSDYQYPDYNYGYAPVHFAAGVQVLDGERALQYARSRHGDGGEGSDFARARRQQEILRAVQGRLLDLSTLLNPNKLIAVSDILGAHLETDMEIWESLRLSSLIKKIKADKIKQIVLSNEAGGFLTAETSADGAYLLRPRLGADNFSEIKLAAQNMLTVNPFPSVAGALETKVKKTRLAILNGTNYPGLAASLAKLLTNPAYQIIQIGNAARRDYEKTVIYNLAGEDQGAAIQNLRQELGANVAPTVPEFIQTEAADVLIIVGKDNLPKDSLSLESNNPNNNRPGA